MARHGLQAVGDRVALESQIQAEMLEQRSPQLAAAEVAQEAHQMCLSACIVTAEAIAPMGGNGTVMTTVPRACPAPT